MKNLFKIFVFSYFLSGLVFAQQLPTPATNQYNLDGSSSFNEIQKNMDDYWESQNVNNGYVLENGVKTKVPNWKLYKRWEYYWEQRVNQKTGEFPTTNSVIEYEKYLKNQNGLNKTATTESWSNLGTNSSTGGYAGIGRINCIAFHPTDANTFWVGSPSGGIWRTADGGASWTILNNNETVLGVSDIAITSDYATSNTLYIATGDRDGGSMWSLGGGAGADNVSAGVYKSVDGGASWAATGTWTDLTATTLDFNKDAGIKIMRLLIHPENNSILFASVRTSSTTTGGIYKSTDAGVTWKQKTGNFWADVEFKPGTPNTMYASSISFGSVYKNISTDGGENWTIGVVAVGWRGELAVSADDPTVVYLLAALIPDGGATSGGLAGVYKSVNSGATFTRVDPGTKSMLGYYSDGSGSNTGQGGYDLCIAASPTDADIVFIGGINNWKSVDGGTTWTINNMWTSHATYNKPTPKAPVAHADKHALAFQSGTVLFEGNDGGIYKTVDGGTTWTDLSNGLVISQVYRIGISQTDANVILTGLQDNGSKKYIGALNTWVDVTGGDGMECIVDFTSATTYMYATYVRGEIYRNSDGFSTFATTTISDNIGTTAAERTGAWVTPYIMDPTNAANLFAGYDKVWKTTDRGNTWTSASQVLSPGQFDKLRSLAIAPSNTSVLYTADQGNMWKTLDGGATNWSTITLPTTANSLTYIAVKNNDPSTVWITYGGYTAGSKVYQSVDGGANWTNISTGLPNLPVMCIVQYKTATDRDVLFVGTDVGVYVKDGANNWAAYNTGLPNVVVTELEILYTGGTNKLRAGTYGRGLWQTDIDAALPVELSSFTGSFNNNAVTLKWTTETEVDNYGFEIERKSKNNQTSEWTKIGFANGSGNSNSPKNYSYEDRNISFGTYLYRLKQIDNNGQFKRSDVIEVFTGLAPTKYAVEQNYPNPFNPATTIKYQLPKNGLVQLKIYDLLGSEVAVLVNEIKSEGEYSINFDASNLPSGVYLYSLRVNDFVAIKKMTLIK